MIARYNRRSFVFGIPGVLLRFGGLLAFFIFERNENRALITALTAFGLGTLLLLVGLIYYAKAKGRSGLWAVFSILGILGLLVLAALKDLAPDPAETAKVRNPAARAAAFCGALSIIPLIGFLFSLFGLVCGGIGLAKSHRLGGRRMAAIGMVLSVVFSAGWVLLFAVATAHEAAEKKAQAAQMQRAQARAALRTQPR